MSNVKIRKPATWLLVAALAVFSLASVACADTSVDEKTASNDDTLAIGAPSSVVGNISSGGFQGSSTGSSQVIAPDYDSALIEPYAIGVPAGYGQSSVFNSSVGTTNSGIWVTGQGTIEIPADVAQVSIGVESRETTVSAARQKAADAMESVLDAIKDTYHGLHR
jgi:hypothetical protein